MQRRRNLAAPIHRLPIEVLVLIFAAYAESSSLADDHSLLDLTTVSKAWYNSIVHSPELWTILQSDFSPKIAKLVLQRSKNLPLSLIWNNTDCEESDEEELEEILELALQNSRRLKSIDMIVPEWGRLTVGRLLESNLPCLEKLEVKTVLEDGSGERLHEFKLSDGPPLREIALDRMSLSSWSSPRLTGLFALELTRPIQPPTVEELLDILYHSPQLEHLRLCDLFRSDSTWNRYQKGIITLPRLKEIFVEADGLHLSTILTTIYAPSSNTVHIRGYLDHDDNAALFEEVCTLGNNQLKALLGLEDSGQPSQEVPVPITISVEDIVARIVRSGDGEEREIVLYMYGSISARVVELLGQFFLSSPQIPAVDLTIRSAASSWRDVVFDLLPWSRSLRTLSVHQAGVCRSAVKQLGEQTENAVKGVLTWVCPNLTSIQLCYWHSGEEVPELDGLAIEALVRARWSEGRDGGQLSDFTIRCTEERYPDIWSRKDVFKQIMPSLSIYEQSCFA
ncbi:hypothetical protein FRC01_004038 [Tulasnella sp. 417]|nr:hypothetical protein FRC01_004038 [Tulasnella sp. 417]